MQKEPKAREILRSAQNDRRWVVILSNAKDLSEIPAPKAPLEQENESLI
jgi:hypothetical protein